MTKRAGNLMWRITQTDNLHEAFLRAVKGKSSRQAVIDFRNDFDANIEYMRKNLADGTFKFGDYTFFTVFDPKKRQICAASFPERIAFHAIMRVCHPIFDNYQIADSYASRIGKGTYKALDRARYFSSKNRWFAKLDMVKYFDSINHCVMKEMISGLIKDKMLIRYFYSLIEGYHTASGRGLPIGNLTSQYFANHYLSIADHYAKEQLHVKAYVRYMDDIVIWGNDKASLMRNVSKLQEFIRSKLLLEIHQPVVNKTHWGLPYLGYVVYTDRLRLTQRNRHRFIKKMKSLLYEFHSDIIGDRKLIERATSLYSFVDKAKCGNWKKQVAEKLNDYDIL